jgi:hypothetical protein
MKLEDRLRRAGDRLDTASAHYQREHDRARTERSVDDPGLNRSWRPNRRLVLAAAAVAAVAAAASVVISDRDTSTEVVAGKVRQGRQADVRGVLVTPQGLLDLRTRAETPLTDVYQVTYDDTVAYSTLGPGGHQLFYTSYQTGGPWPGGAPPAGDGGEYRRTTIRVRDLSDGSDELLADGARSVAVSHSGRIAFARGTEPNSGGYVPHYWSEVMVQDSVDTEPQVWSSERGEYLIRAWAGDRLFAAKWNPASVSDLARDDVVVFDGPGRERVLSTEADLLALSPDGATALVAHEGDPWGLLLIDVASGVTRTVGAGDPDAGRLPAYASWVDDTVVVTKYSSYPIIETSVYRVTTTDDGPTLALEKIIDTGVAATFPHGTWLMSDASSLATSFTPSFGDGADSDAVQILTCTIATGDCDVLDIARDGNIVVRLSNPSRPLPEGIPVEAG